MHLSGKQLCQNCAKTHVRKLSLSPSVGIMSFIVSVFGSIFFFKDAILKDCSIEVMGKGEPGEKNTEGKQQRGTPPTGT